MSQATTSKTGIEMEIDRADRYRVSVEEYRSFREQGFLVVRGLVSPEEVTELRGHTEDLMQGVLPQQQKQMSERDTKKRHRHHRTRA